MLSSLCLKSDDVWANVEWGIASWINVLVSLMDFNKGNVVDEQLLEANSPILGSTGKDKPKKSEDMLEPCVG